MVYGSPCSIHRCWAATAIARPDQRHAGIGLRQRGPWCPMHPCRLVFTSTGPEAPTACRRDAFGVAIGGRTCPLLLGAADSRRLPRPSSSWRAYARAEPLERHAVPPCRRPAHDAATGSGPDPLVFRDRTVGRGPNLGDQRARGSRFEAIDNLPPQPFFRAPPARGAAPTSRSPRSPDAPTATLVDGPRGRPLRPAGRWPRATRLTCCTSIGGRLFCSAAIPKPATPPSGPRCRSGPGHRAGVVAARPGPRPAPVLIDTSA